MLDDIWESRDRPYYLQPVVVKHHGDSRAGTTTRFPARFTLMVGMAPCPCGGTGGCSCSPLQARVADARDCARHRLRDTPWRLNSDIPGSELARNWRPEAHAIAEVTRAVDLRQISLCTASQVIRVAWTLADLAGMAKPGADEGRQALAFQLGISF